MYIKQYYKHKLGHHKLSGYLYAFVFNETENIYIENTWSEKTSGHGHVQTEFAHSAKKLTC